MSLESSNRNCGTAGEHPSVEHLRAYHQGELSTAEVEAVQEHFLACAECRETLLELAEFLAGSSRRPRWDAEEMVVAWRQMRAAMQLEDSGTLALAGKDD